MAVSPASLANLKSWKPGQSGNPAGTSKLAAECRAKALDYSMEMLDILIERALEKGKDCVVAATKVLQVASVVGVGPRESTEADPLYRQLSHEELVRLVAEPDPVKRVLLKREFRARIDAEANASSH